MLSNLGRMFMKRYENFCGKIPVGSKYYGEEDTKEQLKEAIKDYITG